MKEDYASRLTFAEGLVDVRLYLLKKIDIYTYRESCLYVHNFCSWLAKKKVLKPNKISQGIKNLFNLCIFFSSKVEQILNLWVLMIYAKQSCVVFFFIFSLFLTSILQYHFVANPHPVKMGRGLCNLNLFVMELSETEMSFEVSVANSWNTNVRETRWCENRT